MEGGRWRRGPANPCCPFGPEMNISVKDRSFRSRIGRWQGTYGKTHSASLEAKVPLNCALVLSEVGSVGAGQCYQILTAFILKQDLIRLVISELADLIEHVKDLLFQLSLGTIAFAFLSQHHTKGKIALRSSG